METKFITIIAIFCISFLLGFAALKMLLNINGRRSLAFPLNSIFLPVFFPALITFSGIYFFLPKQNDFLSPISFFEICSAFLLAGTVWLVAELYSKRKTCAALACCAGFAILSFFLPESFLLFNAAFPFWIDRILLILLFGLFAFCFPYLNGIDGLLTLQLIAFSLGVSVLSLCGGTPYMLGIFGWSMSGLLSALFIFNTPPARLKLTPADSIGLGFLISWLLLHVSTEEAAVSCLTYGLFYIYTVIFAAVQKFSLNAQKQNITTNTDYWQAFTKGLPANDICRAVSRILLFLIIVGTFQIYAPNSYSIPALSLLAVVWFCSNLKNWNNKEPSFKEINEGIITELKNNINEIKNNLRKDD